MKNMLFFLLSLPLAFGLHAQSWFPVGSRGFSAGGDMYNSITIDASNTLYVAYRDISNGSKATVMKYNSALSSDWTVVGSPGFSAGWVTGTYIALDTGGTPYVVYEDSANSNKATVMRYNGSNWVTVGSPGFSAGEAGGGYKWIAIDKNGTPYVAYADGSNSWKATVMKYNGSSWVAVGSPGFSAGEAYGISIAIDTGGTPYVVYGDWANHNKATVMKYDGSNWVAVGSADFSSWNAYYISIAIDSSGTPYVAYDDYGSDARATVMKFDGSSWVAVGSPGFSDSVVQYVSIALDGSGTPYVVYYDVGYGGKATVMKYADTGWMAVGSPGFSPGSASWTSITIDGSGTPYVVYTDDVDSGKATVMRFGWPASVNNIIDSMVSLSVFPNPNNGTFTAHIFSASNEKATIIVNDIIGQKINELSAITNQEIPIQLNVPPGIYVINVSINGQIKSAMLSIK